MSGTGSGPLQPTWHGFIQNSMDGLMLFEACLSGKLHHVPRRPHDRERASLIKSGSVFIYEENASGIKRWTDGVAWSPSRILGNFLIYRELEKPFPPGEKKRAMKRKRSSQEPEGRRDSEENEGAEYAAMPPTPPSPVLHLDTKQDPAGPQDNDKEMERQLIGSLVDSYGFRPNGLVKKTMSISLNGVSHHLVSYYTVEDVKQRRLNRPLTDSRLAGLTVRPELFMKQNFRAPVEETEHYAVDAIGHAYPHMVYSPMVAGSYALRPGTYAASNYPMYSMAGSSGTMYSGLPATAWPTTPQSSTAPQYSSQPYAAQGYDYYNRNSSSTPQATSSVKPEEGTQTPSSYSQYPNSYQPVGRNSSTSGTYPPMQSQYQSPMRTSAPTYGNSQHNASTPSSNPSQQLYGPTPTSAHQTQQQYPSSSYAVHSNTQQSSSPHSSLKSPPIGGPPQSLNAQPPRSALPSALGGYQGSYPAQDGGMSMNSSYGSSSSQAAAPAYGSSGYSAGYGVPPQNFRPSTENNTGVSAGGQY
ncbi:hypothetical protein MBLNU459_g5238t1 [Dothideomycetes sp. NU459]